MARKRRHKPAAPAPEKSPTRGRARFDAFANTLTGVGTAADPSYYTHYCLDTLSNEEALNLWRTNPFAAKVVEKKPAAALRPGFEVEADDDDMAQEVTKAIYDMGVCEAFLEAGFKERALGGAAIWPIMNDGTKDFSEPLGREGRRVEITTLRVLSARDLTPASYYRDITHPKWGKPMRYRITASSRGGTRQLGQLIHESRLITFPGIMVERDQQSTNTGWGDSYLNRVDEALRMFGMSWAGIATLMHRIEQGVLKMQDLASVLGEDEDATATNALIKLDRLRTLMKMMVIDKDDDYQRLGVQLAGVPQILELMFLFLSAAADMPQTYLFGRSPAGQNATGEGDAQVWYEDVGDYQSKHLEPRLKEFVNLYCSTNESVTGGQLLENLAIKWRPQREPSEKEQAETHDIQASADQKNIDSGIYTAAIARRNRYGGKKFSTQTTITPDEMKELEDLDEAAAEAEITAMTEPVVNPTVEPVESPEATEPAEAPRADRTG